MYLNIIMRNRNLDFCDSRTRRLSRRFSMELYLRFTILIPYNLDFLERGSSTSRLDSQTLEHSFLCTPSSCKTRLRRRCFPTIRDFRIREISFQKLFVFNIDGRDCLDIDTNIFTADTASQCLDNGFGFLVVSAGRVGEDVFVLGIETSERIQVDSSFFFGGVGCRMFDLDEIMIGHTLVEVTVGILFAELQFGEIGFEFFGFESCENVVWMNDDDLSADLSESERGYGGSFQSVGLHGAIGEDEVIEFLEERVNLKLATFKKNGG